MNPRTPPFYSMWKHQHLSICSSVFSIVPRSRPQALYYSKFGISFISFCYLRLLTRVMVWEQDGGWFPFLSQLAREGFNSCSTLRQVSSRGFSSIQEPPTLSACSLASTSTSVFLWTTCKTNEHNFQNSPSSFILTTFLPKLIWTLTCPVSPIIQSFIVNKTCAPASCCPRLISGIMTYPTMAVTQSYLSMWYINSGFNGKELLY